MIRPLAPLFLLVAVVGCGGADGQARPQTCPAGTAACGDECVDLRSDPTSCGACGAACVPGDACSAGACRRPCETPRFDLDHAVRVPVGRLPAAATGADADGDGLAELAVVDAFGGIDVVPQTARGEFGPPLHVAEGNGPIAIAAADLDEDGLDDLVVGERYEDRVLSLRANGEGSFAKRWIARVDAYPMAYATGDLDGDGHLDIVATAPYQGEVILLLGTGTGEFSVLTRAQFTGEPAAPAIGDFDGDGRADVAFLAGGSSVAVVLFRRDGGYEPSQVDVLDRPQGLAAGDFDGDGLDDLAVSGRDLQVLLGRPTGPFERLPAVAGGLANATLLSGDLDGDGHPEVVALSGAQLQVVDFAGTVAAVAYQAEFGLGLGGPVLVDLDGDRVLDLVTTWPVNPAHPVGEVVAVYATCL
jgi:hypothetical protein